MKNFAGRTKICKTLNCNKEVWIDDYCKKCADYVIQKETLLSLETNSKLMLNISTNMRSIENRLSNIESNYSIPGTKETTQKEIIKKENIIKKSNIITDTDMFIPSINSNTKAKIFDNKTTTSNRDIPETVKKLLI